MVGTTGSGKSHLCRVLSLAAPRPLLIIDPRDSTLTEVPGAATFRDPNNPPAADIARFVPNDPYDLDAYNDLYGRVLASGPRFVWCDEAGIVFPVRSTPRAVRTLLVQGRKERIGHLACHTRPRELDVNLLAQAQHVVIFALPVPDDRRRVAELVGIPPAQLDELLAGLPKFGFLWWRLEDRVLIVFDPLPA